MRGKGSFLFTQSPPDSLLRTSKFFIGLCEGSREEIPYLCSLAPNATGRKTGRLADGAALARKFGCDFMETSAKTTQNIERLFINLIRSLRQTLDTESKQEPHQSAKKERESHAIVLFCRTFSGFAKLLAVSVCVDFRVKFPSLCFFFVVNLFHLYLAIFSKLLTCVRDGISKECQPSSLSSPISRVTWRFSTEQGSVGKIIY